VAAAWVQESDGKGGQQLGEMSLPVDGFAHFDAAGSKDREFAVGGIVWRIALYVVFVCDWKRSRERRELVVNIFIALVDVDALGRVLSSRHCAGFLGLRESCCCSRIGEMYCVVGRLVESSSR